MIQVQTRTFSLLKFHVPPFWPPPSRCIIIIIILLLYISRKKIIVYIRRTFSQSYHYAYYIPNIIIIFFVSLSLFYYKIIFLKKRSFLYYLHYIFASSAYGILLRYCNERMHNIPFMYFVSQFLYSWCHTHTQSLKHTWSVVFHAATACQG